MTEPTTDEMLKAATTFLEGDIDNVDVGPFIRYWLDREGYESTQIPEREGSAFFRVELHSKPKASEPYLREAIENAIGTIVNMTVHGDAYREQQALEKALRDVARAIIASK